MSGWTKAKVVSERLPLLTRHASLAVDVEHCRFDFFASRSKLVEGALKVLTGAAHFAGHLVIVLEKEEL